MVLVRRAEMFWYVAVEVVVVGVMVGDEEEGAGEFEEDGSCGASGGGFCERRAWIRAVTYSRTWVRISIPFVRHAVRNRIEQTDSAVYISQLLHVPTINVSGITGASATSNPPNPHPISATSTFFTSFRAPAALTFVGSGSTYAG